jgi:hypothetical protein
VLDKGNCDSIPSVGKSFSLLTGSGTHSALYSRISEALFPGVKRLERGGVEDKSQNVAQSSA